MLSFKNTYSLTGSLANWQHEFSPGKKYIYGFCSFVVLMAVLELGQDYISSILNENHFQLTESLSYKLFWLLFIPFSTAQAYLLEITRSGFSGTPYLAFNALFVLAITLMHLMIFSFFLFGISEMIHESPWSLSFLITEKLSTRLYIGLSIYIVFATVHFLAIKQKMNSESNQQKKYSDTIPVKNGRHTVLVDVEQIKWIQSDGPYLYIHTADRNHVVLDSLKNIITTLPENFKRIHRSTIINIDIIKKLKSRGNGDYDVITDDEQMLRLSRNYAKSLKGLLL